MRYHKPPANDVERLANVLEGLAWPDDDATDEEIIAEAEASGIDFEAWAAEIRAKVEAAVEKERRRRGGGEGGGEDCAPTSVAGEGMELTAEEAERAFFEALSAQRRARAGEGRPMWAPAGVLVGAGAAG